MTERFYWAQELRGLCPHSLKFLFPHKRAPARIFFWDWEHQKMELPWNIPIGQFPGQHALCGPTSANWWSPENFLPLAGRNWSGWWWTNGTCGIYVDATWWVEITNTRGMSPSYGRMGGIGLGTLASYVNSDRPITSTKWVTIVLGSCYSSKDQKKRGDKACSF